MTVLLDTNIIMDALQERQPFDIAAKKILLLGQSGKLTAALPLTPQPIFSFCTAKHGT